MPQIVSCPFCQQQFTIAEDQIAGYVNSQVTCSSCHKTFSIVQSGTELKAVDPAQPLPATEQGRHTNGLALAGLICSIAGIPTCGLAGIAGIICSALGLKKAKVTGSGRGIAIAGIVIGVLSLLFMPALLVGILLPSLQRERASQTAAYASLVSSLAQAKEKANQIKCASNLRQIGMAAQLYAQDNLRLRGPYGPGFDKLVQTQPISPEVFKCPSDSSSGTEQLTGNPCSYIWLGQNLNVSSNPNCVLAYEPLTNHGNVGSNFLFADGHVEFIVAKDAAGIVQQLDQGKNPPKIVGSSQPSKR